jgi:uncharacterized protein YecE (DUF72 family)
MIRAGIGGWTYEPWGGAFYPAEVEHNAKNNRMRGNRAL